MRYIWRRKIIVLTNYQVCLFDIRHTSDILSRAEKKVYISLGKH